MEEYKLLMNIFEGLLIIFGLIKIFKLFIVQCNLRVLDSRTHNQKNTFLIVIPVFNEQLRIKQCIEAMEKLSYKPENVRIVFCTTEKESATPSTSTLIMNFIEKNNLKFNYEIVHYPFLTGHYPEQVNFAFANAYKGEDYFLLYSADSIPHKDSLKVAAHEFNKYPNINYIQQRSIYFENVMPNFFSRASAMHQSVFDLGVNMFEEILGFGSVCGRSVFIRSKVIKNSKVFPTSFFCEDIVLSSILALKKEKIRHLPIVEMNEPAPDFNGVINQHFVWFDTAFQLKKIVKYAQNHEKLNLFFWLHIINRAYKNFNWLFGPIILLILTYFDPIIFLFVLVYSFLNYVILNVIAKPFKVRNKSFQMIISYAVFLYICNLGPLKNLAARYGSGIFKIKMIKHKTPRG